MPKPQNTIGVIEYEQTTEIVGGWEMTYIVYEHGPASTMIFDGDGNLMRHSHYKAKSPRALIIRSICERKAKAQEQLEKSPIG